MSNHERAIEQCERIVELIEEDLPDEAYGKASDFFDSVLSGVKDMQQNIEERNSVTEKMQRTLDNWEAGVRKWVRE